MSSECTSSPDHRALLERFCHEVVERGNLDALDELMDEHVHSHSPFPAREPGRAGLKRALAALRQAFPDLQVTVRDTLVSGDKAVAFFTLCGSHRDAFMGLPATGRTVCYDEMAIVRFADGKIVEHWSVADTLSLMKAIGAVVDDPLSPSLHGETTLSPEQIERIHGFFERYAARFNGSLAGEDVNAREVAESFASHFVEASPHGVNGGKNGPLFRFMIPRGFAHYKKLGTTQMAIKDLTVEPIDPLHALCKVHWDSHYERKDGSHEHIEFDVTYLLHFEHDEPKIFAYVTGDEARMLREHGIS